MKNENTLKKANVYMRYPLSSVLIYYGTTGLHYLLGGIGIILGYNIPWIGILYLAFAFVQMYVLMLLMVCPNCVYCKMKNLMGINWNRGFFHANGLHQCIADVNTVVKQDLIIMDANRVLLTNGPSGPGQTSDEKTVIAGTDPVAIDTYATTLLRRDPHDIRHIQYAYELGIGEMDLKKLNIKEISGNQY